VNSIIRVAASSSDGVARMADCHAMVRGGDFAVGKPTTLDGGAIVLPPPPTLVRAHGVGQASAAAVTVAWKCSIPISGLTNTAVIAAMPTLSSIDEFQRREHDHRASDR
jgi:hypothetical protein